MDQPSEVKDSIAPCVCGATRTQEDVLKVAALRVQGDYCLACAMRRAANNNGFSVGV